MRTGPALAFRVFGGSPNRCPGRLFATTEVTSAVTLLIMRYEIESVGRRGWDIPRKSRRFVAAVPPLVKDIEVIIREREGWYGK